MGDVGIHIDPFVAVRILNRLRIEVLQRHHRLQRSIWPLLQPTSPCGTKSASELGVFCAALTIAPPADIPSKMQTPVSACNSQIRELQFTC